MAGFMIPGFVVFMLVTRPPPLSARRTFSAIASYLHRNARLVKVILTGQRNVSSDLSSITPGE